MNELSPEVNAVLEAARLITGMKHPSFVDILKNYDRPSWETNAMQELYDAMAKLELLEEEQHTDHAAIKLYTAAEAIVRGPQIKPGDIILGSEKFTYEAVEDQNGYLPPYVLKRSDGRYLDNNPASPSWVTDVEQAYRYHTQQDAMEDLRSVVADTDSILTAEAA